jgi:alkylhydroperoxidase family enzyme
MTALFAESDVVTLDDLMALPGEMGPAFIGYYNRLMAEESLPAVSFELCRLRLAQLVKCESALQIRSARAVSAGLDEAMVAALSQWSTDPRFSDQDRACLAWTEQFRVDPNGVTDQQSDAVRRWLGEAGLVAFDLAVALQESMLRMVVSLGVRFTEGSDAATLTTGGRPHG